jgi:cholesterol transport system auxiliary component
MKLLRLAALPLALALILPACTALRSLDSASRSLDTFELQPLAGAPARAHTGRSLAVEGPTASGALATERILVKPNPLQIAYLPGARWVDAAPVHVQSLLIRSIANSGRTGFVGQPASGPLPDYDLLTDLEAFQAEVQRGGEPPYQVVVRMTLTLVRDLDGRVVATRRFERSVGAPSSDDATIVSAFNVAMSGLLAEVTAWTVGAMSGAGV